MSAEERLRELGIDLPSAGRPVASYVPVVLAGAFAFVSGQVPIDDGALLWSGKLGRDLDVAAGAQAAERCALQALAALPNVTCKLSGMVTEAPWHTWKPTDLQPYADVVLDAFGPDRVMFGSDWPVCLLAASYAEVVTTAETLTSALSASDQQAIFNTTATSTYKL